MKRILLAALLCATCVAGRAQVPGEEPFHGGVADGHALGEDVNPFAQANAFSPYRGGVGDGHSLTEDVTQLSPANAFSPYRGGIGDGYDGDDEPNNVVLAQANNFSPFIGGVGEGYDGEDDPGNIILPQAIAFGPFLGGIADGHAGLLIPSVTIVGPLSTALLSFEGRAIENGNLLFWKSGSEKGLVHFGLERSADGRAFSPLATVGAKGRTEYNHTDAQPLTGHNYYRLRVQDADGSHAYSNVVLLIRPSAAGPSLVLFPNPARHTLRLQHERLPEGTVARVVDVRGSVVWQAAMAVGNNIAELPVDQWTPGNYVLHLAAPGGWREEVRFVKQ